MRLLAITLLLYLLVLPVSAQISSPQVPTTGNLGPGGTFPLFNHGTIVMSSDADRTLVYPEMSAAVIVVTSTVPLTATRNVINPSNTLGYKFTIENATTGGQAIVFKGSTGTGVNVPNGRTMAIISDGTNYVRVGVDPTKHNAFGGVTPIDSYPTWPNSVNEDGALTGLNINPAIISVSEQPNLPWSTTLIQHTGILSMPNYISKTTGGGDGTAVWGDASVDASSTAAMSIWGVSGTADDYSNAGSTITNQYVEGLYGAAYHNGNTTSTFLMGTDSNAVQAGSGTVQNLIGVSGIVTQNAGSGTVLKALAGNFGVSINGATTALYGVWTGGSLASGGNVGNYYANYVQQLNLGTGSTLGHAYSFVSEPGAGNFGINTITPSADLEVVGTGKFTNVVISGGTCTGCTATSLSSNGTANQVWGMDSGGTTQGWRTPSTTATGMSTNGTSDQVWGMNAAGTSQGWQAPPSSGGPAFTQVSSGVTMSSTAGPLQLTASGCATTSPFTCTAVTPTVDTSYRLQATVTQTAPGGTTTACTTSGSIQLWMSYTDADSGFALAIGNGAVSFWNYGATSATASMTMGNAANNTTNMWTSTPISIRVKNNTSLTYRIQQSVATAACVPQPTFTVRFVLY